MLSVYVRALSTLLWIAVVLTITTAVLNGVWILIRRGSSGTTVARRRVASGTVSGLGLTTAIALLATTQLRTWHAFGMFTAALALRTLLKFTEERVLPQM